MLSKVTMSLNQIKEFHPCTKGWKTLLKALGKIEADDEPISLEFIVESNGVQDTIWCMRVNWFEHKKLYMRFVRGCVERARQYAADSADSAADSADSTASTADSTASTAASDSERQKQKEHLLQLLS